MNWQHLIKYASVQLRKIGEDGVPCGIGSGCLLDIKGHRFLITVFHVAEKSSSWCAQIQFDDESEQIEVLFLNTFSFIGDFSPDKSAIVDVEFSFHPVRTDFKCYFQNRNWRGETVEFTERPIIDVADVGEPSRNILYGFSGDIRPELIPDQKSFVTSHHIYHGLKYDRTANNLHYFKMPEKHPGHDFFEGCSGSPIIGEDGKVVSLVSGGSIEANEIYGANLSKCIKTMEYFLTNHT